MCRNLIVATLLAGIALTVPAAHASGPIVAIDVQSGSQSGSQNGTLPARPIRDPAVEAHNRGKALVSKKIGCKKCTYPRGVKDTETARKVADEVRAGEFDLKDNERQLVLLYLSNRFGI